MAEKKGDFIQQETQATLNAIKRRSLQTWGTVKKAGDPTPWIIERPITSVLAAAGGGLVAGLLLTPSRRRATTPASEPAPASAHSHLEAHHHRTLSEHLESEVFRAIRPALRGFAASAAGSLVANLMPHHEYQVDPRMSPAAPPPASPSSEPGPTPGPEFGMGGFPGQESRM